MGRLTPSCSWSVDHKGRPAAGEVDAGTLRDCPDAASAQGTFAEAAEFPQRLMIHRASTWVRFLRWYASVQRRIRELGIGFTFPLHLHFSGSARLQPVDWFRSIPSADPFGASVTVSSFVPAMSSRSRPPLLA
jgi:hypothetical protein